MIKKEIFIEYELAFLETKLEELKDYIKASPFSELEDRFGFREGKNGGTIPYVIAKKEDQRKDLTQALKDCAELAQTINRLRAAEPPKERKGGTDIPSRMK